MMTGKQLGHYLVGEKLGEGGMGIVYMGTDTRLRRPVALKFLTRALPAEASERKRFLREARAASSVNHPNVCVIHAIEEIDGEEFIVMEYIEGVTLRKWARQLREQQKSRLLPVHDALRMVMQVAEGLEAAHKKGIVHRDVKPENVMITPGGHAKIMDFGLAKLANESKLTRTGATVGTVAYMSPEQVQGGLIDAQSDIFSLGVLFYELLADRTPFVADHVMGMMYAIVNTEPEAIQSLRSGLDTTIASLVMKCLAKHKSERVASMGDIISVISRHEAMQRTVLAQQAGAGYRGNGGGRSSLARIARSRAAWLTAAGVAVAAACVVFLLTRGSDDAGRLTQSVDTLMHRPDTMAHAKGKSLQALSQGEKKFPPADTSQRIAYSDTNGGTASKSGKGPIGATGDLPKTGKGPTHLSANQSKTVTGEMADEKSAVAPLSLELSTSRGSDNPRFTEGDTIRMYVRVNRPCMIRVLYHTADGTLYALTGPHDRRLESGDVNRRVLIESSACSSPFGRESLHAFATTATLAGISTTGGGGEEYCRVVGDPYAALAASRKQPPAAPKGAFAEKEIAIVTSAP